MRRRLRSTIKWSGTALTVLLLVVWVGSARWMWGGAFPKTPQWQWTSVLPPGPLATIVIRAGCVQIAASDGVRLWSDESWDEVPRKHQARFGWWFSFRTSRGKDGSRAWYLDLPIWALAILAGVPTIRLWYRDRRRAPGLCINCGYDLRGTDHAVCPECGAQCEHIDRRPAEQMSGGSPN